MGESFLQHLLTVLILLHLHQQLSQVVAQEVVLLRLQGSFIVVDGLCVGGWWGRRVCVWSRAVCLWNVCVRHKP